MVTGLWAGTSAGKDALSAPEPKPTSKQIDGLRDEILAPLSAKKGYSPYDAIEEVQEVVFKLKNTFIKSGNRLERAIDRIEEIKAKLPKLSAADSHELVRCHEAKSMLTNAEIFYKASLVRTETRGSNIREDYPKRDNKDWLKWIIGKNEGGELKLRTEPVPIKEYKYRP
jgi:succinate dehydrogenase/fumarate reductase flavoprotein subunit